MLNQHSVIVSQCWLYWLMLCLSVVVPVWADDDTPAYQLGRGYAIGNTGARLGGYASVHAEAPKYASSSFSFSNLNIFASWDSGGKFRFFSETEIDDIVHVGGSHTLSDLNPNVHLERFYMDYLANEALTVRAGKILTPVGQWNQIHVDPLVWTTTRPVATDNLFSDYATGIMLQGTLPLGERSLDYSVYADYTSSLDPTRIHEVAFDNAQGLHLRYHLTDNLKLGLSYSDFTLIDIPNARNHLLGLDFAWTYHSFAVNSEFVYRNTDPVVDNDYDNDDFTCHGVYHPFLHKIITSPCPVERQSYFQGYVQGVAPISSQFYVVGRYEFFDWYLEQGNQSGQGQAEVFGFIYRPQTPVVLKLEYRLGKNNRVQAPDGLFASFSVLF